MIRKLSVVVLAAAMLLCTVQASHAVLTAVGPTSPATGYFPVWYQDANTLPLELCLSQAVGPNGPMCVLLPSPPYFDETLPVVFPVNFPDESFWFSADGILENGNGTVSLRYVAAVEAAFAGGGVVNGDQVSFARIRFFADVPSVGTYTITHPYGVDVFNVAVTGAGREIQFTRDIGLGAPGNFTGALGGDIGPFLRAAATPGGAANPHIQVGNELFIGDPNVLDNVTGSPNGTNFLRIEGPGIGTDTNFQCQGLPDPVDPSNCLQTNLFTLAGKVFGGVLPANVAVDRATYSRSAAGESTVDVFSTSGPTYNLTFRDTITPPVPPATEPSMAPDAPPTGKFYGRSAPAAVPPYVIVTAVDPALGATPTSLAGVVVDVVKITRAQYDPARKNLTIEASSSDNVAVPALPTLTAVGYGPLAPFTGTTQRLLVQLVDVPPARVTVKSSGGGADTEPVTVIPATSPVPVAADDFATTPVNTPVTINALDNDTGGTPPVTVANLTQPANGSATTDGTTVTYTPNNCFTGTDTFTYTALDSLGAVSNVATVTVSVTAVPSTTPVAVNDGPVGTTQGTPSVDINVAGNDTQGDDTRPLKVFSATQPPAGTGTVQINVPSDGFIRYSPPPSVFGTITFTYRATNDVCAVSANSATVTVRVNGKPVANNVSATTPAGTPVGITLSATDPDGNTPLTYIVTQPSVGTVTNNGDGTVTFDPLTATNGTSVTFTYTATDTLGAVSNTATVTVLINAPLVAAPDTAATTARTPTPPIAVLSNDTGGTGTLTVVNLTQPSNGGTAVLNANGTITYTPGGPGTGVCPSGTGTFTYQARDSVGGTSSPATVTVTVTPRAETQTATASARRTNGNTRAEWTINGTTSVPRLPNGTPNTITVRLTNTGQFIATANPDTRGRWKISLKGSTVVPPATGAQISLTSSYCNPAGPFPVTVR